jgi:hypothetical protein
LSIIAKEIILARKAADAMRQPARMAGNEIWFIKCMGSSKDIRIFPPSLAYSFRSLLQWPRSIDPAILALRNSMAADRLEARQHVHQLIEQLGPEQIDAVARLLEVMVEPDDEPLSDDNRRAVIASREYFRKNPGQSVSFEELAAECGFTMDQIRDRKD